MSIFDCFRWEEFFAGEIDLRLNLIDAADDSFGSISELLSSDAAVIVSMEIESSLILTTGDGSDERSVDC